MKSARLCDKPTDRGQDESRAAGNRINFEPMEMSLRAAPRSVATVNGSPAFGSYQGELVEVDLQRLGSDYRLALPERWIRLKKWTYSLVATPEVIALFAIVDLSYSGNAFAVVVDRRDKRVLFDGSFMGAPAPLTRVNAHPGEGLDASFRSLGASFRCHRGAGRERYRIEVDARTSPVLGPRLRWDGEVLAVGGPPALTVIAPVGGNGSVNVTQKWAGLLAFGSLRVGDRSFVLDGGVAGMDYTHGYLARHTAWRWALGVGRLTDGTPVGLNLVEGFNETSTDANENALWIGRRLIPLDRARFDFNRADPLDGWSVKTVDGALDLRFKPLHAHREDRDYKLIRSHFVQPVGTFEGTVQIDGETLPLQLAGVTEDQDVLW